MKQVPADYFKEWHAELDIKKKMNIKYICLYSQMKVKLLFV